MKYVIYAIKNECGSAAGQWIISWCDGWKINKPCKYGITDINAAHIFLADIADNHWKKGCNCDFEIQEIE